MTRRKRNARWTALVSCGKPTSKSACRLGPKNCLPSRSSRFSMKTCWQRWRRLAPTVAVEALEHGSCADDDSYHVAGTSSAQRLRRQGASTNVLCNHGAPPHHRPASCQPWRRHAAALHETAAPAVSLLSSLQVKDDAMQTAMEYREVLATQEKVDSYLKGVLSRSALGDWFETGLTARQPALRSLARVLQLLEQLWLEVAERKDAAEAAASYLACHTAAQQERPAQTCSTDEEADNHPVACTTASARLARARQLASGYTAAARARLEALMKCGDMAAFFFSSAFVLAAHLRLLDVIIHHDAGPRCRRRRPRTTTAQHELFATVVGVNGSSSCPPPRSTVKTTM